ncbi:hypothetical protein ACLB2K_011558 [Fragaria x ananassa]
MGFIGLWKIVVVKNLPYADMRRVGKIPKLLPHRLFPSARKTSALIFGSLCPDSLILKKEESERDSERHSERKRERERERQREKQREKKREGKGIPNANYVYLCVAAAMHSCCIHTAVEIFAKAVLTTEEGAWVVLHEIVKVHRRSRQSGI